MHLLYADESGSIQDASQRYFVLAGFSVFERKTYWMGRELDAIAARFDPAEPHSIELHGSPMLNGFGIWRRFTVAERVNAIKDALQIISVTNSAIVFASAIVKTRAAQIPRSPLDLAFEQIASRFDQYLMRFHRKKDPQRGIIVFDKTDEETSIQSLASDFRTIGHTWGKLHNLAEVPLFLDSGTSRLVQLADLIAYGVFRHFERGDSQFFNIIKPNLDAEGGTVHGLYTLE